MMMHHNELLAAPQSSSSQDRDEENVPRVKNSLVKSPEASKSREMRISSDFSGIQGEVRDQVIFHVLKKNQPT